MPIYNGTNTLKADWDCVGPEDLKELRRNRGWGGWQRVPDGMEPTQCAFATHRFGRQGEPDEETITQCRAVAVWTWAGRNCYCDEHKDLLFKRGMREKGGR